MPLPSPGAASPSEPAASPRSERAAVCALLGGWLLLACAVGLGGEHPLNDDWSYSWSARHLANTGEVRILDWAAPSLVSHVAWGALVVRLFGPGEVALRLGTLAWAAVALWALYRLGRRAALSVERSLLLAASLGLSPWFVNLSFTYMTDVPWLAAVLLAMLALVASAKRPYLGAATAGLLLSWAALGRQFAVILVPAFAALAVLDARAAAAKEGRPWLRAAALRLACLGLPVAVVFGAFLIWYGRVHLPTTANLEFTRQLQRLRFSHPLGNFFAAWHYAGLWLAPLVLAAVWARRRPALSRRALIGCAVALTVFTALMAFAGLAPYDEPFPNFRPLMPYLSNLLHPGGLGPPTLSEEYSGRALMPRTLPLVGWPLTLFTLGCGLYAAGWIGGGVRRVFATARLSQPGPADRVRLLLLGSTALYFCWHLCTTMYLFDRYLYVGLPAVVFLAIEALPEALPVPRLAWALTLCVGLFSVWGTRDYLAWNGARAQAVRDLQARGVPPAEIDAGFEFNEPRCSTAHPYERGVCPLDGAWFRQKTRYLLSFSPEPGARRCAVAGRYPSAAWPGARGLVVYVLDCAPPG